MKYNVDTKKAVWRNIDGEVVILNLDSGHYYGLNKTASLVWLALCENKDAEEIVDKLCSRYSISKKDTQEDVRAFVKTLEKEGLLLSASD